MPMPGTVSRGSSPLWGELLDYAFAPIYFKGMGCDSLAVIACGDLLAGSYHRTHQGAVEEGVSLQAVNLNLNARLRVLIPTAVGRQG